MTAHTPVLRDMSEDEFDAYLAAMLPVYAADVARATGMSDADARARSQEQIASLLPDGTRTAGHAFLAVEDADGARIGACWTFEGPADDGGDGPVLFLYDIHVAPERRGRGVGSAILAALADGARARGLRRIVLHVFEHNSGAIRLYERLGFATAEQAPGGRRMVVGLGAAEG